MRRDDVESLVYILIYFFYGHLPWENVKCKNKEEKYEKIFEMKKNFRNSDDFKNLPDEIKEIYEAVVIIEFEAKPNYDYYENLAEKLIEKSNFENDFFDDLFDWQKIEFMIEPIFMINELKKKKNEEIVEMKLEDDEKKIEENVNENNNNNNKNIIKRNNKRRFSQILPKSYQLKNLKK